MLVTFKIRIQFGNISIKWGNWVSQNFL